MANWYEDLTARERRAFTASFGGWALDAFDFMTYSFVIPTLIAVWGMSKGDAGLIGSTTLLSSALGGWLAGILADRFGRARILQITILWFSAFTFLSGFTSSRDQLLICRALLGLGFGGEWAVGSVLIAESVGPKHRGTVVGMVQSGWAIGWAVANLAFIAAFSLLDPSTAWKCLFWLGALPALFVFFIRRHVQEPEIWKPAEAGNFLDIFKPRLLATTCFAALLTTGAQGGYYSVTTWLPTFLKTERGLSVIGTGSYVGMVIFGSFCGYASAAFLCDIIGRKRKFILFAIGSAATLLAYTLLPIGNGVMLFLGFPLGFFASGIFSGMGSFLAELFPGEVRGSAQGFTYNAGRGIGALFPAFIGYLANKVGLGTGIALFAAIAYGLILLAACFLPETKGKSLGN